MSALFDIIAEMAFELPPERIELLAEKARMLNTVAEIDKIRKAWGQNIDSRLYSAFCKGLLQNPNMSGSELAIAFQASLSAVQYSQTNGHTELIWTGPLTSATSVRHIEQALCELISFAKHHLFLVSFVAYKAGNILDALTEAMLRNVEISILLESSKEQGGTVSADSFAALHKLLPAADLYSWSKTKNPDSAAVHAKCAVADDTMAIISSANLTGKAMESNMELGTLTYGGTLPRQLSTHLNALITEKVILPLQIDE